MRIRQGKRIIGIEVFMPILASADFLLYSIGAGLAVPTINNTPVPDNDKEREGENKDIQPSP